MSVKYLSPEEFDLLFETLKALNPNLWTQRIAHLLQYLAIANQMANASSYHSCSLLDEIQPWKPRTEEIDCKPGIPSRYEGSLFRWITNHIYNCKGQEGTCFLPERIQDGLFDLVPAYDFRNQRP